MRKLFGELLLCQQKVERWLISCSMWGGSFRFPKLQDISKAFSAELLNSKTNQNSERSIPTWSGKWLWHKTIMWENISEYGILLTAGPHPTTHLLFFQFLSPTPLFSSYISTFPFPQSYSTLRFWSQKYLSILPLHLTISIFFFI